MQPQLECKGNQCPSAHAHLHQLRPSGDHQAQGPEHDPTLGRSKLLQGQEDEQEQDADSIHEPMSLKPGLRKRVFGEIEKAIDHLEKESQLNEQTINELSTQELQEVMRSRHLRLIGEVFMPRTIYQHGREIQPSSRTGLWSTARAATSFSQAKKIMLGSHSKATICLGGSHSSMRNVFDVAVSRTRQLQRNLWSWSNFPREVASSPYLCWTLQPWYVTLRPVLEVAFFSINHGRHDPGKSHVLFGWWTIKNIYWLELISACLANPIAMTIWFERELDFSPIINGSPTPWRPLVKNSIVTNHV